MSFIFCLLCYFLLFFHNNRAPGNSMQPMPVWRLCSAPSVLHIAGFLLPASPEVTNIMLFQSSLTDATWAKVYFCYFHAACKIPKNKNPTISHRVLYLLRCGRDSNKNINCHIMRIIAFPCGGFCGWFCGWFLYFCINSVINEIWKSWNPNKSI